MRGLLNELSRRKKQAIAVAADVIMLPLCLYVAFALRLGEWVPDILSLWPVFVVCVCVAIPTFGRLGLYRQVVRYMGNHAIQVMILGCLVTTAAIGVMAFHAYYTRSAGDPLFPRSIPIIFFLLAFLYVSGSRFAVRMYLQHIKHVRPKEPIVIFGAGVTGAELARLLKQQEMYYPVAFIDDEPSLWKRSVDNVVVYPRRSLEGLLNEFQVKQVFVAISDDQEARREIIEFLETLRVRVRLIPDIQELVEGDSALTNLRDVQIEDLLGRDEVEPLLHLLEGSVKGKQVLVTGAGGSIGSELCRQIVRQSPAMLVLIDQSEYALFQIHRELVKLVEQEGRTLPIVPVLGTVIDTALLTRTFRRYQIETIYHAAAYKHVGLVENNVIQGIKNNTFGTLYCAQAAMDCGVERFMLISTDKAVRTTSVMGASKRLAEMVLQALQEESEGTRFSMVRFGNVLGSSGSVVPLFAEQIDHGGPVTVTHAKVTRYFMSIPEAAQLVLQAASLGRGGDLFLLDMGEPVRIVDLAHRMIRLKGLTVRSPEHPNGNIEIHFTGLRPGEKMHEELLVGGDVMGTEHRKIMRAEEGYLPWKDLRGALNTLEQACDTFDYDAIKKFIEGLVEGADLESQLGDLRTPANVVELKRGDPA